MKKHLLYRLLALVLAMSMLLPAAAGSAAAAGGDQGGETAALRVVVDPARLSLPLGSEETLTAKVLSGETDVTAQAKLSWSITSGQDLLTIAPSDDGGSVKLSPKSLGEVILTATAEVTLDGRTLTSSGGCTVNVVGAAMDSVVTSPKQVILDVGERATVNAYPTPSTADSGSIKWTVSYLNEIDKGAVTLPDPAEGGSILLTGVQPGQQITLTAYAGTDAESAKVKDTTEVVVRGIRLTDGSSETSAKEPLKSLSLRVGLSRTLTATPIGNIGSLVTWESGNDRVAFVNPSTGEITAQTAGTTQITAHIGEYSASCELTVVENTANVIETTAEAGVPMKLYDLRSDLEKCCADALEGNTTLSYLANLSVPTSQGVLYYGYVSGDSTGDGVGNERYYLSDSVVGRRRLSDVYFVPNQEFSGTATISYYGFNSSDQFFVGAIRVKVDQGDDVTYTTAGESPVTFQSTHFNEVCKEKNGRDFRYITFDPPQSRYGTLYYNYQPNGTYTALVNSTLQFTQNAGTYRLDGVSFVPAKGFVGTVRIAYRGQDTSGRSFSGRVTIIVNDRDERENGDVTYTSAQRQRVTFRTADFTEVCEDMTDGTLNYIRFDGLPSGSEGTLYYNYKSSGSYDSRVSTSTRYYRSGSPSIANVSFLPASGYNGTVVIPYTGYDRSGEKFTGHVRIRVGNGAGGGSSDVTYSAQSGTPLDFEGADFNEACQRVNGARLSYVRFELPSSSRGTLYYNYRSSSNTGSAVSASRSYYYSGGSYQISNVTFLPRSTFSGTVEIPFTGSDVDGGSFDGAVVITVSDSGDASLRYSVQGGSGVTMRSSDFNSACRSATGDSLDYVRFNLPASSRGTLYYQWSSRSNPGSRVSASTSYYRSATGSQRQLDDVTFEAAVTYTGTAEIDFTGWSVDGKRFEGTVEIAVSAPTASTIRYSGSARPIAFQSGDFSNASNVMLGRELDYIRFTSLPSSAQGRLYLGYSGPASAATAVASGTSYYLSKAPQLSQISFVPKAGYQGRVSIPFVGTDTSGKTFSGTVEITLSNSLAGSSFRDLGDLPWAAPSVEYLYQYGIVNGIGDSRYGPRLSIKRGDFVLMLTRAFQLRGSGGTSSFADVPASSYYAQAMAAAKELGIVRGSGQSRFRPNASLTRQDAMVMIQRAMEAAGRPLSGGASLDTFRDGGRVADYARTAAAALVSAGVVQGSDTGQLNPTASISRAEMAVILHRALTL